MFKRILLTSIFCLVFVLSNKATFVLAEVRTCNTSDVDNGNGTCTTELALDPDTTSEGEDALLTFNTFSNSYSKDTAEQNFCATRMSFVDIDPETGEPAIYYTGRAYYFTWDITSIPDRISVDDVRIVVSVPNESSMGVDICGLINTNPALQTAQAATTSILNSCTNYQSFLVSAGMPFSNLDVSLRGLTHVVLTDFVTQLPKDWFALAVKFSFDNVDEMDCIKSEENPTANPPPTLKVVYHMSNYQITGLPSGLLVTDNIGNDIKLGSAFGKYGSSEVNLQDSDGIPLGQFVNVNFDQDLDWSGISSEADTNAKKAFIHITGGLAGFSGSYTLYVPKGVDDDAVAVCPGATSLNQVTADCVGKITLGDGGNQDGINVTIVTINTNEYWKITGLTGTGAYSFVTPLADTPTATPTATPIITPTPSVPPLTQTGDNILLPNIFGLIVLAGIFIFNKFNPHASIMV